MDATVIWIIVIAVVLVVVIAVAAALTARRRRLEGRRNQARQIRTEATAESYEVSRHEALAEETAAKARIAEAEADAKQAQAERLQLQAQARGDDAAAARHSVNDAGRRADAIDPDTDSPHSSDATGAGGAGTPGAGPSDTTT